MRRPAYTMANAVRNFFRLRLLTLGTCKQYAHASSFRGLAINQEPPGSGHLLVWKDGRHLISS